MLKKIILAGVLTLSLCATAMAAKVETPVTNSKIFQDSEYKISVQLPEGFDYADDNSPNVVVAASDKKGGFYKVTAEDTYFKEGNEKTDKERLQNLADKIKAEYEAKGFQIYEDYMIKINPDHCGYFMDGFFQGANEVAKSKNAIIVFFHNGMKFTVTLKAPYENKSYLANFKRFRTSITCRE